MWLHTDAAVVQGNRWNNLARFSATTNVVAGLQALVVPDVAEEILITNAAAPLQSILTNHQADTLGQVVFIKVVAGGSNYTEAHVEISGSGNGAAASAIISNGQVAWIVVTNAGSGYGPVGSAVHITVKQVSRQTYCM